MIVMTACLDDRDGSAAYGSFVEALAASPIRFTASFEAALRLRAGLDRTLSSPAQA